MTPSPQVRYAEGLTDPFSGLQAVEVDHALLQQSLVSLGERFNPEDPPIVLTIAGLPPAGVPPTWRGFTELVTTDEDASRLVTLYLGSRTQGFWRPPRLKLWSETSINGFLMHELRHAVDYTDPVLVGEDRAYKEAQWEKKRWASEQASQGGLGEIVGRVALHDRVRRIDKDLRLHTPMERRAWELMKVLKKTDAIPRIVRLS